MDVREIIRRFKAAGLATIPGGGGEIFAPRVRKKIGIGKCTGDDWLRVMRVAHEEGMNTSCTMLIGHIEFVRERIEHLSALRDMQDYAMAVAETKTTKRRRDEVRRRGIRACSRNRISLRPSVHPAHPSEPYGSYTAFIHWPFQRENTPLGRAKEWDPEHSRPVR